MIRKLLFTGLPFLLFASVVGGQLIRLKPFPDRPSALLALDLSLMLFVGGLLGALLVGGKLVDFGKRIFSHPVWQWSVLFLAWAGLSLLINAHRYEGGQVAVAASYLVRLTLVLLAVWLSAYFATRLRARYLKLFTGTAVALVIAGLLQFIFLYDFRDYAGSHGWDPHYGRMLATFFDPNYFGTFLVLVMVVALARSWTSVARARWAWLALFGVSWAGLFLAYSRSAWLAGLIAVPAMVFRKNRWAALLLLAVFIGVIAFPSRLSQRFADSRNIIKQAQVGGTDYNCNEAVEADCDISGSSRVISFKKGLELVQANPVFGVGYNAYGPASVQQGLVPEGRLRSPAAQGSDSSLLNVLATTGAVGMGLFLAWIGSLLVALNRLARRGTAASWLPNGLFWFTIALLIGSFFNNSVFYLSIMVPWLLLVSVYLPVSSNRKA